LSQALSFTGFTGDPLIAVHNFPALDAGYGVDIAGTPCRMKVAGGFVPAADPLHFFAFAMETAVFVK